MTSVISYEFSPDCIVKYTDDSTDNAESHFSPYLWNGTSTVPLTMSLIQNLPEEKYGAKEGVFIKGDGSLTNWKKRYFVLRGGLLMYFKNNLALTCNGCIPLKDCVVEIPNENRKSFSWKGRTTIDGFELSIAHKTRRSFMLIFETLNERNEWKTFLSNYIIMTFLSRSYEYAKKIALVDTGCLMIKKKVNRVNGETDLLPSFKNHSR